jgi:8-oxo-dGTP pyrophosphatase MutT (NUDIX family)
MYATPRDAASVILVRSVAGKTEALLVRKRADLAFAGGQWVYPGGKLETADLESGMNVTDFAVPANHSSPEARHKLQGLLVASCREAFEESGVLLARFANGEHCDGAMSERLQMHREEIGRHAAAFTAMLTANGLSVDPSHFIYWSHWITPSIVQKRFDTRFFVAVMPPDQPVRCDTAESTELHWVDLHEFDLLAGEALIPAPPTRYSLADLAAAVRECGTIDAVLRRERGRHVSPVMPKMARIDGMLNAVLPWDPEYPSLPGDGIIMDTDFPLRYRSFPSRVVPPANVPGMPS